MPIESPLFICRLFPTCQERVQRQVSFWVKRGVLRPSIQSESSSSSSDAPSASSSVVFQYTLVEGDEAERAAFEKISKLRYEERLEEVRDPDLNGRFPDSSNTRCLVASYLKITV